MTWLDEAMIERKVFSTYVVGGREFGAIETAEGCVVYGLSCWPSHSSHLILYIEDEVEWARDEKGSCYRVRSTKVVDHPRASLPIDLNKALAA